MQNFSQVKNSPKTNRLSRTHSIDVFALGLLQREERSDSDQYLHTHSNTAVPRQTANAANTDHIKIVFCFALGSPCE